MVDYHSDDACDTNRGACVFCGDFAKRYYFIETKIQSTKLYCQNEHVLDGVDPEVTGADEDEIERILELYPCCDVVCEKNDEMNLRYKCKCLELVRREKTITITVCRSCFQDNEDFFCE